MNKYKFINLSYMIIFIIISFFTAYSSSYPSMNSSIINTAPFSQFYNLNYFLALNSLLLVFLNIVLLFCINEYIITKKIDNNGSTFYIIYPAIIYSLVCVIVNLISTTYILYNIISLVGIIISNFLFTIIIHRREKNDSTK